MTRCTCHDTLVVKNLNRWFKEKWVDVSRTKDGKHPPCGRSKGKLSGKGYPKCRPSIKVSSKTPKTSGSMSSGEKQAATKRKRAKKQGVGGKPTIVKTDYTMRSDMNAFDAAWSVLKSNTIPIRPKVMQYATDPKKTMRFEQTGGVARSARKKLMDETQAERNHDHPDSFSEGETDVMNHYDYREHEPYEMFRDEEEDLHEARLLYDPKYRDKMLGEGYDDFHYTDYPQVRYTPTSDQEAALTRFDYGHPLYSKDMHRMGFDEYDKYNAMGNTQ